MKHVSDEAMAAGGKQIRSMLPDISPDQLIPLWRYLDAVLEENTRVNLTAVLDANQAVRLHVVDSLVALPEINSAPEGPLLDLGSGGGFPGVPLGHLTGRSTVLLDSVAKKTAATERALAAAALDPRLKACAGRAEEYASEHAAEFAIVVARAVAPLPSLVELASPLLMDHGHFIALKARVEDEELLRGDEVGRVTGLERLGVRETVLPGGDEVRTIVVYVRSGDPVTALPRRVGMAQKRPLA